MLKPFTKIADDRSQQILRWSNITASHSFQQKKKNVTVVFKKRTSEVGIFHPKTNLHNIHNKSSHENSFKEKAKLNFYL